MSYQPGPPVASPHPPVGAGGGWPAVGPGPPEPTRPRRRWPIVVGALVLLVLLGGAAAGARSIWPLVTSFVTGESWVVTVGPDGDVPDVPLDVGACGSFAAGRSSIEVLPCTDPHGFELFHIGVLALSPELSLDDEAADACEPAFGRYVGAAWSRSYYDYLAFVPDEGRLAAGERQVLCAAVPFDGSEKVGSVRGIRQ